MGVGPRRLDTAARLPDWTPAQSERPLVDNADSWLGASDLVFVDAVGTGYSRAAEARDLPTLYTAHGDAEVIAEAIRVYLTRHDAWDRPLYLVGESDGVTCAMLVAEVLERRGMPVRGVMLVSYSLDPGTPPAAYPKDALNLPQFAAAAHYHRLRKAMDQDRQFVLTLRGRYDGWPCESSVETTRAAGPRYAARVTHLCLQGGHRWYSERDSRAQGRHAFEHFLAASPILPSTD